MKVEKPKRKARKVPVKEKVCEKRKWKEDTDIPNDLCYHHLKIAKTQSTVHEQLLMLVGISMHIVYAWENGDLSKFKRFIKCYERIIHNAIELEKRNLWDSIRDLPSINEE